MQLRDKTLKQFPKSAFRLPSLDKAFSYLVFQGEGWLLCESPEHYRVYKKGCSKDLLTGDVKPHTWNEFVDHLKSKPLISHDQRITLFHHFYELGHGLLDLEEFQRLSDDETLMVEVTYRKATLMPFPENSSLKEHFLSLESEVSKETYQKAFQQGYEHLLKGNCYQFNLTYPFDFKLNSTLEEFFQTFLSQSSKHGAYAHLSHFPELGKSFLSNSPECLFQSKVKGEGIHMWSMPIKGTAPLKETRDWKKVWKSLSGSAKEQAELYMICDLLRNDLAAIEKRPARVVAKKCPLKVPGLLHQFSLLDVRLSQNIDLYKVLKGIFPGGSVTGAPKKRVMRILSELEQERRGFYCGSTSVQFGPYHAASINIRSLTLSHKDSLCRIPAGGGITLESLSDGEYSEMRWKLNSFLSLWKTS